MASRTARLLGALYLTALTGSLHAEPSATRKEAARGLMSEGRALREQRAFGAALERFRAADAIMGVPTTSYEVARAEADLGQLLEALATVRRLLSTPAVPNEPEPFSEARERAQALDTELEQRIGSLRFVVTGVKPGQGVEIAVDGESVPVPALASRLRVNPGPHRVRARSEGREVTREVEARERDTVDVVLALPAASLAPQSIPRVTYVAGGVAVAGLVVGSVSGLWALSKSRAAKADCIAEQCPPPAWSSVDDARSLATVSTLGFAVGGAGATVALLGWLLAKPGEAAPVRGSVAVSKQLASVSVSGTF